MRSNRRVPEFRSATALLFLPLIFSLAGCIHSDRSIVYLDSVDPLVVNGIAFDKADAPLGDCKRIVIPQDARVEQVNGSATCTVLMKKCLGLVAHPPKAITIEKKRTEMGCAWTRIADAVAIGTIGEYMIEGHGGASMEVTVRVPEGVVVERRDDLGGEKSIPNMLFDRGQAMPGIDDPGRSDPQGNVWTILPSSPAPEFAHDS